MLDLDGLDAYSDKRERIIRAPFAYPGGKLRSVEKILDLLPVDGVYVEPFGGSGVVLLNRPVSKVEVFNDRNSGVTCFYRVIRDPQKREELVEKLNLTVHSREEFCFCRDTWENVQDDVERAYRWYYMVRLSFGAIGRNFGRAVRPASSSMFSKILVSLPEFAAVGPRLRHVQIENLDWSQCIFDYDSERTVFYIDPPYLGTDASIYGGLKFDLADHERLLDTIFSLKGFVALSGYANSLYDSREWDGRHTWDSFVSIKSICSEGTKSHLTDITTRGTAEEVLWIKEAL